MKLSENERIGSATRTAGIGAGLVSSARARQFSNNSGR